MENLQLEAKEIHQPVVVCGFLKLKKKHKSLKQLGKLKSSL